MDDSEGRSMKRPRHGLVALSEQCNLVPKSGPDVVVGECVRSDAVERSGLLSGIANTDGLAALPTTVYPEDLQLWQAACVFAGEPSTDELVTIIRVADAMGDSQLTPWTDLLGKRAHATDWHDFKAADAMACSLLSLPHHLLTPVIRKFTYCERHRVYVNPLSLLAKCPAPLHPELLSAAAALFTWLSVPANQPAVLNVLAATPAPVPQLTMLRLSPSVESGPSGTHADHLPQMSAPLLGRVLAAHPSLIALDLSCILQPQWLTKLAACLPPSLPNLTCLRIHADAHPGACAPLARCLKHLPGLSRLQVRLYVDANNKPPPTLSMLQRAAACPAALTRLTELSVSVHSSSTDHDATTMSSGASEVAETDTNLLELLPLLHAPALDRLSLASEAGKIQQAQLWSAIGRLRAVVCSHLSIEADATPVRGMCGPPDHQVPLPQLRSLDVFSNAAGACLPTAAELLPRAPPAVSRLCLSPSKLNCPSHSRPGLVRALNRDDGMAALSLVLKRFTSLRILKLDVLCAGMGWSGSVSLAHALRHLTALTELSLQSEHESPRSEGAPPPVLFAQPLSDAVPQLQHLQELRLCGRTASPLFDTPLGFLHACSGLHELTKLCLICRDVSFEQTCHAVVHLTSLRSLIVLERVYENCNQDPHGLMLDLSIELGLGFDDETQFPDEESEDESEEASE